VKKLQGMIEKRGHFAKVISKIEKPEAVENIKQIIDASNGIMVARGDLGVEVPMELVPSIQKNIIKRCIQKAKPVIVATQMMDSMINNPTPTRAEITDVANAVLDGTDAVMLSGETSVGKYPVIVVETMNRIIAEAEKHYELTTKRAKGDPKTATYLSDVMCITAAKTAEEVNASGITGLTVSGYTAFKVSSYRPRSPIYIFSRNVEILATLNLVWGVRCYHYDKFTTTDGTIEDIMRILKENNKVSPGDILVNTASMPIHKRFRTNMMKITVVE
jgi:pyruvate kinase